MTNQLVDPESFQAVAVDRMLGGLAAMLRADFGYRPSEAARGLRESARYLGAIGAGDAERLFLLAWKWESAGTPPPTAERDRAEVNAQVADLCPGWLS